MIRKMLCKTRLSALPFITSSKKPSFMLGKLRFANWGLKRKWGFANYSKRLIPYIFYSFFMISVSYGHDHFTIKNFSDIYKASLISHTAATDADGVLYFANEGGVLIYDGSRWRLIQIAYFGSAISLHIASDNTIFVGGRNEFGYLEKDSLYNYEYRSLRHTVSDEKVFYNIWEIHEAYGNIYFSSYEGIIKCTNSTCEVLAFESGTLFKVKDQLFVSKYNGGIYLIEDDKITLHNEQLIWKHDNVFGVVPDLMRQEDDCIIYTSENGLYRYNYQTNQSVKFDTEADSLFKKHWIYFGDTLRDSLYVFSTWRGGLVIIDREGHLVDHITKNEGLRSNEIREFVIDHRGNIWLTGYHGIDYLKWSSDYSRFPHNPKTRISNIIYHYKGNTVSSIEFYFATPGYDISDIKYKYRLKGYDEYFSEWSIDTKKEYTNLDGGDYTFIVKAQLPDNSETKEAKARILIPTLWYNNNYYRFALFLFFTLLIIIIIRYRTKRLKLKNRELEATVEERTRELLLQREQLKKANKELQITNKELDNFVHKSSHDLVAPLKSIMGLINLAKLEANNSNQLTEYLKMMESRVFKLEEFIKSTMEYSVNAKQPVQKKKLSFDSIINSITEDLKYYKNAYKIKLIKDYAKDLTLITDEQRLRIVLSNLITNCVKYHNYNQSSPILKIKAIKNEATRETHIEVEDNGEGIDIGYLNKIFDMFFRISNDKSEGSGLGLYIVKDTLLKINGEIDVKSQLGQGTVFMITLKDT